ncbi:MAG: PAS domain-containing sensor histidine kinase [Desulfobacterales bacterium RIFOXYA12_FULL_46_15]|nr:MAG: PAS domain-containing sensor histidine kinase [Desulfobacterales bacterium RIFOXYA12_FULL_46_15]
MIRYYEQVSLKNQIFVTILVVILIISATIALLARWILISGLTKELELRGIAVAHSIAERGAGFVLEKNSPELLTLIFDEARLRERQHMINYIYVLDRTDQVISHTFTIPFPSEFSRINPMPENAQHSVRLVEHGTNTSYDIVVPMNEGLYRIGTVHVGLSKEHIDKLVSKLRFMFLGFISAVIVIIFYVSHRISRHITMPITRLTRISDELSRGNFDFNLNPEGNTVDLEETIGWGVTHCPAYKDTNMPCRHFDQQSRHFRNMDAGSEKMCLDCLFYRKNQGRDEVSQLADSFLNMVWSIRLYRKRLQESELKYRSLFDSAPNPIFVVDASTETILDANPRAEELYEYPLEALFGMPFQKLGQDHIKDSPIAVQPYGDTGKSGSARDYVYYPKILHLKNGGHPFYVNMHACPISYGGRQAVVVAITDITEMIEKDAQLVQAAKMKTLGEMSAGIAHEINQPLNTIKMGSEYLNLLLDQKKTITEAQIRDMVTEISEQVDRATEIINNLRAFGRKSELTMELVSMKEPIQGVLSIIGRQFSIQKITIRLDLADNLPLVKAQNNHLQQVFFNLLNNARDAIQEKMETQPDLYGDILVQTYAKDGKVIVAVTDNGSGIPESVRGKIFEPFFTTKQTGKGMGLGLAITYGIVRDYGGTIEIESTPGQGTSFYLIFSAV